MPDPQDEDDLEDEIIYDDGDVQETGGPFGIGVTLTFSDGSTAWFSPDFGGFEVRVNIDPGGDIKVTVTDSTSSSSFSIGDWYPPGQPDGGPPHTGNSAMPAVDGDGKESDTGLHPKIWGWSDTKDTWDISDTGTVFKLHGGVAPDDPWDKVDEIGRKLRSGGIPPVEPWDKVGPKYRPIFQSYGRGERVSGYSLNKTAMARLVGAIVTLTAGMQNLGRD